MSDKKLPTAYETLGDIANEVRRMQAEGVTRGSIEYVLNRVYPRQEIKRPNVDGVMDRFWTGF